MIRMTIAVIKWCLALAVVFGVAFAVFALVKIYRPAASQGEKKVFEVSSGAASSKVAADLARDELISRPLFFKIYVYASGNSGRLQAGRYELSRAMSIAQIAEAISSGAVTSDAVKFTVIEGWTVADIGAALEKKGLIKKIDFEKKNSKDEGYLFPDTYFIDPGESAEAIGKKMKQNFEKKAGPVGRDDVILASIVEREVGRNVRRGERLAAAELLKLQEERRLVAGVFQNRLKIGMPLQSDATVGYITGSGQSRATIEETRINSPYNTYKNTGLPPGPIASPGLLALEAALHPAETDYLYFVTDEGGRAYFAKTLAEHEINKQKYLK